MTNRPVTGPLAPLFAQVREESALLADWAEEPLGMGSVDVDNVRGRLLEALSAIERHVQDMEKALRDQAEPIMDERFRDRLLRHVLSNEEVAQLVDAIYTKQTRALNALAALPAREKEEE